MCRTPTPRHAGLLASVLALAASFPCVAEPAFTREDTARILRGATRLVQARPDAWTFMIVTEMPSGKFVQFAADKGTIVFDFPVAAFSKAGAGEPVRDASCSLSAPAKRKDEIEERRLSVEEEARLKSFLGASGHKWAVKYCLSKSRSGARAGYNVYLFGSLPNQHAVAPFAQGVFKDVYQLPAIRSVEIETDE